MPITCKAAITDGLGNFKIEDIAVDDPQADEVLVKINAAGICRTDYNSLSWGKQMVIGHEGAGVVVKTGWRVRGLFEGDNVVLTTISHSDPCLPCRQGNPHLCQTVASPEDSRFESAPGHVCLTGTTKDGKPVLRSFNIGTLAEYTLVKASTVVKNTSPKMSFRAASIINCGVLTGFGLVFNTAKVQAGSIVVVVGTGSVGLNVIQSAKIAGAAKIIAVDTNVIRLSMAKKFGATHIVFANKTGACLLGAAQKVREISEYRGANYVFEGIAMPGFNAAAEAMVCDSGKTVNANGVEHEIAESASDYRSDKVNKRSLACNFRTKIDFEEVVLHYDAGTYMLEEMVTRTYKLSDLDKAFCDMLDGKNAKGVIVFE